MFRGSIEGVGEGLVGVLLVGALCGRGPRPGVRGVQGVTRSSDGRSLEIEVTSGKFQFAVYDVRAHAV